MMNVEEHDIQQRELSQSFVTRIVDRKRRQCKARAFKTWHVFKCTQIESTKALGSDMRRMGAYCDRQLARSALKLWKGFRARRSRLRIRLRCISVSMFYANVGPAFHRWYKHNAELKLGAAVNECRLVALNYTLRKRLFRTLGVGFKIWVRESAYVAQLHVALGLAAQRRNRRWKVALLHAWYDTLFSIPSPLVPSLLSYRLSATFF